MDEPNTPTWVTDQLNILLPVLNRHFQENQLRLGGGTVLQARWQHRISTDIDLFATPNLFNNVISNQSAQIENDLYSIPEVDNERTWVELNTVYCEINGIEVTVMPSSSIIDEESGYFVPTTQISTESTATILHKKIAHRMVSAGNCEIRDLYDLYTAITKDQNALSRAIRPIPQISLDRVSATLKTRPTEWLHETTKPLVELSPLPNVEEMVDSLTEVFSFNQT